MKFVEEAIEDWNSPIAYPDPNTRPQITEVVCGEARGVDTLGKQWAQKHNIPVKSFPANWDKYGKAAGYIRNEDMADYADSLIAVIYIEDQYRMVGTRGTTHMINLAKEKGIPFYIRYVYKEDL